MTDQEIVDEYARSLILLRHQGKRFPNTPKEVYEAAERIGKDQNSCMEELIEQALDALTTAYLYKLDPSKGTDLTIRIERTKSTRDVTCTIELARPGEKVVLHITKAVVQRLKESIVLLTQIPLPSNPPEYCPTIQYRFEDKESGVVVMWEISPFTSDADRESRFKIGDGENLNYEFESFDMLEGFVQMLSRLVSARFGVAGKFLGQF